MYVAPENRPKRAIKVDMKSHIPSFNMHNYCNLLRLWNDLHFWMTSSRTLIWTVQCNQFPLDKIKSRPAFFLSNIPITKKTHNFMLTLNLLWWVYHPSGYLYTCCCACKWCQLHLHRDCYDTPNPVLLADGSDTILLRFSLRAGEFL